RWRFRVYFDGRNENWNLTRTFLPATTVPVTTNLQIASLGAEVRSVVNGRWSWRAGTEYSYRDLRNLQGSAPQAAGFFRNGSSLAARAGLERSVVRFPERRFFLDAAASGELGTYLAQPRARYARAQGALSSVWFPRARGDDYRMKAGLRAGHTFGQVSFDDLFALGVGQDVDLWLRGHPALRHGQKGRAPLGRSYVLANWETGKNVLSAPFLKIQLGPFLDTGKAYDPSAFFGSPKWLCDTGAQARVLILGSVEVILGYGKDLRS